MTKELELDDIGFSLRNEILLRKNNINNLKDLLDLSAGKLRRLGFTHAMILDIRKKLSFHGLSLYGDILVRSSISINLTQDIPQMLESIVESIINLNSVLDETRHRIKDLEEKLAQIIAVEQYKNG